MDPANGLRQVSFLLIFPIILSILTWLCILPGIWGSGKIWGPLRKVCGAKLHLDRRSVRNRDPHLRGHSLAAAYFVALGGGSEMGALFGGLSIWVAIGEYTTVSLGLCCLQSRFWRNIPTDPVFSQRA